MFFLKKSLKRAAFAGLVLVLLAAVLAGCKSDGDTGPTIEEMLTGTWATINYGDMFIITATTFTADSYKGDIVNLRTNGIDSGYITIKITDAAPVYAPTVGNYFVIYFESLTSSTIALASPYNGAEADKGDEGNPSREEAEEHYTYENGYFENAPSCAKLNGTSFPHANVSLKGSWDDGDEAIVDITDTVIRVSLDFYGWSVPLFIGEIDKVVNDNEEGYFIFRYALVYDSSATDVLKGNYSVLCWKDLSGDSVKFAVGGWDLDVEELPDTAESSAAAAESKYIDDPTNFAALEFVSFGR